MNELFVEELNNAADVCAFQPGRTEDSRRYRKAAREIERLSSLLSPVVPVEYATRRYKCPACNRRVRSGGGSPSFVRDNYCQRCGRKLDWEKVEASD